MTNNSRRGRIPSDIGELVDYLDEVEERLRTLEAPGGTQRTGTVAHLAGLKTLGASSPLLSTGTVPNDSTTRWFFPTPALEVRDFAVPTGKLLVTASCGEASIQPGGGFVIAYIGFYVYDANNVVIPGSNFRSGQRYTNIREGLGISTFPQPVDIPDPVANPGPYRVTARVGMWCSSLNTTACSTQFTDMALVVQVIGEGRSA